jgi:DNA-binding NarL/FixJ family response regulator
MKLDSPQPPKNKRLPAEFSPRELEIVRHIATGRTSKEIAALLYLSRKTVESHRTNMFTRLKVRSAVELVCYAIRKGYIKP